jgi:uncharacterized protein
VAAIKEVSIMPVAGLTVRGSLALPSLQAPWPLVVLCHGIPSGAPPAQGEPGYDQLALRITEMGAAACWFNFRGTGASDGNFSLPAWVEDLEALLRALESRREPFQYCDPARTALMGFSGGGAVSVISASRHKELRAVTTLSAPSDFTRLINRVGMPAFITHAHSIGIIRDSGFPPSQEEYYDEMLACRPLDFIGKIAPVPLLIIHGDKDDVVPVAEAERLFRAAGEPKELYIVEGGGHRLRLNEEALTRVLTWTKERLAAKGGDA